MLEIDKLSVEIEGKSIVQEISFVVPNGVITSMIGESGSGKSMTAAAILGLLPCGGKTGGQIRINDENMLDYPAKKMADIRKTQIFTILQDTTNSFNPSIKMKKQLYELAGRRMGDSVPDFRLKIDKILADISLSQEVMDQYPFQLSGGMLQRCMIACAFYVEPKLLIADEPTSAIDMLLQKEFIGYLKRLNEEKETTVLLITHDLDIAAEAAQHIVVLYKGEVVETGETAALFESPRHPYTNKLLQTRF